MTEVNFKDYEFKPEEIIKGLNTYYKNKAEGKRSYVRVLDKFSVYHILNFHVTEAINWLREEHGIFYTPGMKLEDPVDLDIFDTPRYRFLSELSSELGFRTIVGPGNANKTEDAIMRAVKRRNDELKNFRAQQVDEECEAEARNEFLRKLRCELGVRYPVVNGCIEEVENDILERIGKLKEGNWPCENDNTFAEHMKKQFPKECEKWKVAPIQEGSVHDWVQYIFGILDEWRKRALKAEEDRVKLKRKLNAMYGASCGGDVIDVLPCYRDTCNNPKAIKERDAAKDALAELRTKIREVYGEVFGYYGLEGGYVAALDDILDDYKFQKRLKEKAEEKAVGYKMELQHCREDILKIYREIFDCSNGDPEGSDEETLEDILTEYRNVDSALNDATDDLCKANTSLSNLKRQLDDEKKNVSRVKAERDSNKARRLVFLDKLARILDVSYSSDSIPAKEQDILRAVGTLSENYDATTKVLEDKRKDYDNLDALYKSALKLLGEYLTEAKDILGIDNCSKEAVAKAIKDLKSAYDKLRKDYDELGEAYSSVLKWNNSYADVRRLLEVPADADAGEMVGALNKLVCDYEKLKESTASIDQLRQNWYSRYKSEHERANGEHKRAEKCFGEIAALKTQVASLERTLNAATNEQVGMDAFRKECRKLRDEKDKVIKALGQDIWDDCVK